MSQDRETAFRQLVGRHRDLIWRVCSDYSLSAAWETKDAFQEVMCVLWRDFESFGGRSSERTWVYRVATTTMLMLKRKASNHPQAQVDEASARQVAAEETDYNHFMALIGNLEETDQQIVMAQLDGFKYDEIARMVGLSIPTVARRLAKAKQTLKRQYEQEK